MLAAIDAGNIIPVARILREHYPELKLIFCGDDDRWTKNDRGDPWNPGREAATNAAKETNGFIAFPIFKNLDGRPTDFNDLMVREGIDVVKRQVLEPLLPFEITTHGWLGRGAYPLPIRHGKRGPQLPNEQEIVDHLLAHFDGNLVKKDRDLFFYCGTHWRWLSQGEHDRLKVMVQEICHGLAPVKLIDAVAKLLMYHVPSVPNDVNPFNPNPNCANFRNGTLHLHREPTGGYKLVFAAHCREDWIVNILPYDYKQGCTERNQEFDEMLERVFEGNPDKDEKIRAVRQMFGACLMPAFPRLFMLWGPGGTGKSSVINLAAKLVHQDNLSQVPPSLFHGFHMESMAGKLVNLDTDIPLNRPMDDDVLKKVLDRKPVTIHRKNRTDLRASLPAVHIFGGNSIPRTLDGESGAHVRRWTFLHFSTLVAKGNYLIDYVDWCFEKSPQGVLNFALEGLADLCANGGHFVNPESGKEKMVDWQAAADPFSEFWLDIQDGEVRDQNTRIIIAPEARIEQKILWGIFCEWARASRPGKVLKETPRTFYPRIKQKGLSIQSSNGVRYFRGIGPEVREGAVF